MKHALTTVLLVGLLIGLAAPALAHDIVAPPWRGQGGTTTQGWEFLDPTMPDYPDWGHAVDPSGQIIDPLPSTVLTVNPGPGMAWMPDYDFAQGVWPLSGIIDVVVDNWPQDNPKKLIWVQLTWAPMDPANWPNPFPEIGNIQPPPIPPGVQRIKEEPLDPANPNNPWMHSVYTWELDHNPPDEFFIIGGDIFVDELVIDTWCTIPEPGTLAMLAGVGLVGLIAVVRRRRNR